MNEIPGSTGTRLNSERLSTEAQRINNVLHQKAYELTHNHTPIFIKTPGKIVFGDNNNFIGFEGLFTDRVKAVFGNKTSYPMPEGENKGHHFFHRTHNSNASELEPDPHAFMSYEVLVDTGKNSDLTYASHVWTLQRPADKPKEKPAMTHIAPTGGIQSNTLETVHWVDSATTKFFASFPKS